jgi:hypothetical protein
MLKLGVHILTTSLSRVNLQGVHKVSLQFQKFITKENEKKHKWKLLQNETYIIKFFASFNTPLYEDH